MARAIDRRTILKGTAAGAALASLPWGRVALAQSKPVRVGLLTVLTGPLAQGGIQMKEGLVAYLKDKNYNLAGRKVDLFIGDTGGNPAGAKAKTQELVERDHVDFIVGPLAAFEMIAISDYVAQHKVPLLCLAGADNMTQRTPNPYFLRASATASQCNFPLADYARKEMKLSRMDTIVEDFAFGYEQEGGFQLVFDTEGGKIVKRLWTPIKTPDYTPYLAQISDVDGVWQGFAGSNPINFMKQYAAFGLKKKYPVVGGWTAFDDALLPSFGDDAIGAVSGAFYSVAYDSPSNNHFVELLIRETKKVPGGYAAGCYINGMCIEAALKKLDGNTSNPAKTIATLRALSFKDSPRGPFHFDHFGNVVGNVFIRRLERKNGKLVNAIIKTYPNVSQFWTFNEKAYLATPLFSRNKVPAKI